MGTRWASSGTLCSYSPWLSYAENVFVILGDSSMSKANQHYVSSTVVQLRESGLQPQKTFSPFSFNPESGRRWLSAPRCKSTAFIRGPQLELVNVSENLNIKNEAPRTRL